MASKYVKKSHLEHILDRPDTYIGSCESVREDQWLVADDGTEMQRREIEYVPGLYKIFDEILNNSIDQAVTDATVDAIKIKVDATSISVTNTGTGIPVEMHPEYNVYVPELIFGNLLTSSNYDDSEARITGGRNGYGAKLANIFSSKFVVDIVDIKRGLAYKQTFEKNMTVTKPPTVRVAAKSVKKGHVTVTFFPELSRFSVQGKPMTSLLEGDILELFRRRAFDCAACTPPSVAVTFGDSRVPIKSFDKYIDLFLGGGPKTVPRAFERVNERWEVCVARSRDGEGFAHVSFVNGISTAKGGTHVQHVVNQVIDKMRADHKRGQEVRPYDLKERIVLFVRSTLVNPTFTSQTKEECASKVSSFGSRCDLSPEFIKKAVKLGIIDEALEKSTNRALAKNDGAKRSKINVPKLEDANKAGTAESHKCTLVLTEGDSAKTFAISGLSEVDRNYWGVFPLKGKMLNVRDASARQVAENQEITYLKQILGLQHGKVYADVRSLRYGRVMLLTDADHDGYHIKGLVLNMFHQFWPSLVDQGYVCTMNTPVVKVFRGNQVIARFFTVREYQAWRNGCPNVGAYRIKYYKGLGTSTAVEAKEYFREVQKTTVTFETDAESNDSMELAFRKTLANRRKDWVLRADPQESSIDSTKSKKVAVASFINKDLVLFSVEDVNRSIPSMVDGLKPSQRKVLYACLKRNLKQEIRVSQLAGHVSEVTSYHHGEASLCGTIVAMAQDFAGSNNMNLLSPIGQFGTRLAGGKDASSPRYIFTRLEPWVQNVFCKSDESLLDFLDDDGTPIEPKTYFPVLPMVLVNGAEGIGTGFSTSVPCYDPGAILANIRRFLAGEAMVPMHPWYRGFKGVVRPKEGQEGSYEVVGCHRWTGVSTLEITELPVGTWTNDYKEFLESDKAASWIASVENHSTETSVLFRVRLEPSAVESVRANPEKALNLVKVVHTGNMHLFDAEGQIRKYGSPLEILEAFCKLRLAKYVTRKEHLSRDMERSLKDLDVRVRFIEAVVSDRLKIFRRKTTEVLADMRALLGVDDCEALLQIPAGQFTADRVEDLRKKHRGQAEALETLKKTPVPDLWAKDLGDLAV
jgi:DNA topoisomerase II